MIGRLQTTTVLTADVVDSTALQISVGDDVYFDLMSRLHDIAEQITTSLGGQFLSTEGDALWAAFDASVDGVTAAVRLMQAARRLDRATELPPERRLTLRIGVTTGDVAWTEAGTDCNGIARNLAKRLETRAPPGTIQCSAVVPFLAGAANRHQFERRGMFTYKGFDDPIETWEVKVADLDEHPVDRALPVELAANRSPFFVGRASELETIADAWDRVVLGSGQLVAVSGEAGQGKTSLCHEVAKAVVEHNAIVLYGRVDEHVTYPYQPFVEALQDFIVRAQNNHGLFQTTVGPSASELSLILPELLERPDVEEPPKRDFRTQRHMLFEAMAKWIRSLASVNPVMLVLDDLTWADDQTLAMMTHLVRRILDGPVLIVCSFRPAEVTPHFIDTRVELARIGSFLELELAGLSEVEVLDLLRRREQGGIDASRVRAHTGGNPFFLHELLREFDDGAAAAADSPFAGRAQYRAPRAVKDLVATRARRLLDVTRDFLATAAVAGVTWDADDVKTILGLDESEFEAALAEADAADLIRAADRDRGETGWGFTHAIIRDAIYDQIPRPRRVVLHGKAADRLEFRWAAAQHPGSGGAISAAATLRGTTAPEHVTPAPADIAYHHLAAGGRADKVIEFSVFAARDASSRFAFESAATHYANALTATADSDSPVAGLESSLLFGLGVAQRRAGRPVSVERSDGSTADTLLLASSLAADEGNGVLCARAVLTGSRGMFTSTGEIIHERLSAIDRALELVPERTALRASLLATKAVELTFGDEFRQRPPSERRPFNESVQRARERTRIDEMKALAQEAVDIAREVVGPTPEADQLGPLIEALSLQIVTLWRPADLDERLAIAEELQAACVRYRRPQATLNAATVSAQAAMEAGDVELADVHMRTIAQSASELRQPTVLGYAFLRQAMRKSVDGFFVESERLAEKSYEYSREAGQPDAPAFHMGQIFNLRYHQGRVAEVVDEFIGVADAYPGIVVYRAGVALIGVELDRPELIEESLDRIYGPYGCGVPNDLNWLAATAFSTEAAARIGDERLCRRFISELTPYRTQFVDNASTFFGSVERFVALAFNAIGDVESATSSFEAAIEAHQLRAPVLLARTQLDYAEFLLRRRQDDEGRRLADSLLEDSLAFASKLQLQSIERRCHEAFAVAQARAR